MARTEELVIGDVKIVVSESTMRDEHRRVVLQAGARAELQEQNGLEPMDYDFRFMFVDFQVATRSVEGLPWPLDFATFETWPSERYLRYVVPWANLVYDLNSHWLNVGGPIGESEKDDASVPA